MMDTPNIGQIVRLNSPKSLEHGHKFEVVATSADGKFADIQRPGSWRVYTEPVSKLMHSEWLS